MKKKRKIKGNKNPQGDKQERKQRRVSPQVFAPATALKTEPKTERTLQISQDCSRHLWRSRQTGPSTLTQIGPLLTPEKGSAINSGRSPGVPLEEKEGIQDEREVQLRGFGGIVSPLKNGKHR